MHRAVGVHVLDGAHDGAHMLAHLGVRGRGRGRVGVRDMMLQPESVPLLEGVAPRRAALVEHG